MKRKTFFTTLIGGVALLPVAIKEAAAQLRKPKDDTASKCPIVMLTGSGGIIAGRLIKERMTGENLASLGDSYATPEIEFGCEVKLTRRNLGWLGANRGKQVTLATELHPVDRIRMVADCLIIDQRIIDDHISVTLTVVITDYYDKKVHGILRDYDMPK